MKSMRKSSFSFRALALAGVFACGIGMSLPASAQMGEMEEDQPALSPEIGKILEAAEADLQNKDASKALEEVTRASKMPNTNAFDNYMIQRMRAAACTQKEEIQCALSAYDSLLGNSQTQPNEKRQMMAAIPVLAYRGRDYRRCEKTALEYLTHEGYDKILASLLVQCPYVAEDWLGTVKAGEALSKILEKYKKQQTEASLQMLAVAYGRLNQPEEERRIYTDLAEKYPNPQYWEFLLHDFMSDQKIPQRLRFNVMRLRLAVGGKLTPKEFQDMAERAIQMEVPSLALKLLQTGYQKKILGQGSPKELQEEAHFKNFVEEQVYKARRGMNEAIVQARRSSSAGVLLSTGYELVLEGHVAAGLSLMREGMENQPNYPHIAELEYAMAEMDGGQKGSALRQFQKISGNGPAHSLGILWAKHFQSQSGK